MRKIDEIIMEKDRDEINRLRQIAEALIEARKRL